RTQPTERWAIGDRIRYTTKRRASSDEQEKRPSQSETARKRSKFSGVRKTPAASSARPINPFVPRIQREKILIWQGFSGVHRSRCIRGLHPHASHSPPLDTLAQRPTSPTVAG